MGGKYSKDPSASRTSALSCFVQIQAHDAKTDSTERVYYFISRHHRLNWNGVKLLFPVIERVRGIPHCRHFVEPYPKQCKAVVTISTSKPRKTNDSNAEKYSTFVKCRC
jgi:hypothetical protein